jgi:beta-galactosidase
LGKQGVKTVKKTISPPSTLLIVDGSMSLSDENKQIIKQNIAGGADVWIWGITPQTVDSYNSVLPLSLSLEPRAGSSFLPEQKSWVKGLNNSDFYFCELQKTDASQFGLSGDLVNEGETLLNVCKTDWRKWNKQAEEIKTSATLRSENEGKGATPVFIKYKGNTSTFYISTLTEFVNSEKGFNTLSRILANAGIPCEKSKVSSADIFFIRDEKLQFPANTKSRFKKNADGLLELEYWIFSPRPLDDLLIEPDMPKLNLLIEAQESKLSVNGKKIDKFNQTRKEYEYKELPLQQGWNRLVLTIAEKDQGNFWGLFNCGNKTDFLYLLKVTLANPETN